MRAVWIIILALFPFVPHAMGQENLAEFVRSNYTKQDYYIPMRDGVHLFTSVYSPHDTNRTYAIMMVRTPYSISPYGITNYPKSLGPSEEFTRHGFIFAYQDARGRYKSEGDYTLTCRRPKLICPAQPIPMKARMPPIVSTGSSSISQIITATLDFGAFPLKDFTPRKVCPTLLLI